MKPECPRSIFKLPERSSDRKQTWSRKLSVVTSKIWAMSFVVFSAATNRRSRKRKGRVTRRCLTKAHPRWTQPRPRPRHESYRRFRRRDSTACPETARAADDGPGEGRDFFQFGRAGYRCTRCRSFRGDRRARYRSAQSRRGLRFVYRRRSTIDCGHRKKFGDDETARPCATARRLRFFETTQLGRKLQPYLRRSTIRTNEDGRTLHRKTFDERNFAAAT